MILQISICMHNFAIKYDNINNVINYLKGRVRDDILTTQWGSHIHSRYVNIASKSIYNETLGIKLHVLKYRRVTFWLERNCELIVTGEKIIPVKSATPLKYSGLV